MINYDDTVKMMNNIVLGNGHTFVITSIASGIITGTYIK